MHALFQGMREIGACGLARLSARLDVGESRGGDSEANAGGEDEDEKLHVGAEDDVDDVDLCIQILAVSGFVV